MFTMNPTAKSTLLIKGLLVAISTFVALSCHAQTAKTASTPAATTTSIDKQENHDHKHQLPTDVSIPHRLEPVATQAHPEEIKRQQQHAASLPQK